MLSDKVSHGTAKAVYSGHPSITGSRGGYLYSTSPPLQSSKISMDRDTVLISMLICTVSISMDILLL